MDICILRNREPTNKLSPVLESALGGGSHFFLATLGRAALSSQGTQMYNKLFGSILDSSIWLESHTTRIVFLTFLAAMDGDGFAKFSAIGNLAARARVTREEAEEAVKVLEAPDQDSASQDFEGRRIERVPGGWMILNAKKYRAIANKEDERNQTKLRVQAFRQREESCNGIVTPGNGSVTESPLTSASASASEKRGSAEGEMPANLQTPEFFEAWQVWLQDRAARKKRVTAKAAIMQLATLSSLGPEKAVATIYRAVENGWVGLHPENGHGLQKEDRDAMLNEYRELKFERECASGNGRTFPSEKQARLTELAKKLGIT